MSHETSRETTTATDQTEPRTYDLSTLETALGPITAREFDAAKEYAKPTLWDWLLTVPNLSDDELYHAARSAIYESALVIRSANRFNFEHVHCKATACYSEAERRLKLESHDENCRPSGIYGRAHADVMIDHGYEPSSPVRRCTCKTVAPQGGSS